jgi:acyl-CoA thioester hydrolase
MSSIAMSGERAPIPTRGDFRRFLTMPTRWMDNDVYGHVNNVVYYSYIDTAVNRFLIEEAGLDFTHGSEVFIVVENACRFHKAFTYPEDVDAGIAITQLGRSSVQYSIGLFGAAETEARADARYVHVCVEKQTMRPAPIPDTFRTAFARISR